MSSRRCGYALLQAAARSSSSRASKANPTSAARYTSAAPLPTMTTGKRLATASPRPATSLSSPVSRAAIAAIAAARQYSTASSSTPAKSPELSAAESAIWDKLARELAPTALDVRDVSGGCGSMYSIEVTAERFRGLSLIRQQRMVNEVLKEELKSWHGVNLRTLVP